METTHDNIQPTAAGPEARGEIVLYQPDKTIRLEVRMEGDTVWLSQAQMAELFQRDQSVIARHISNIYKEEELTKDEANQIALQSQDTTLDVYVSPEAVNQPTHSRSQFATLNKGRGSNMKYLPYAFTGLGVTSFMTRTTSTRPPAPSSTPSARHWQSCRPRSRDSCHAAE